MFHSRKNTDASSDINYALPRISFPLSAGDNIPRHAFFFFRYYYWNMWTCLLCKKRLQDSLLTSVIPQMKPEKHRWLNANRKQRLVKCSEYCPRNSISKRDQKQNHHNNLRRNIYPTCPFLLISFIWINVQIWNLSVHQLHPCKTVFRIGLTEVVLISYLVVFILFITIMWMLPPDLLWSSGSSAGIWCKRKKKKSKQWCLCLSYWLNASPCVCSCRNSFCTAKSALRRLIRQLSRA